MKIVTTVSIILLVLSFTTRAEVIEISVSQQAPERQAIERPANGMSKEAVDNQFGAPQQVIEAVGQPPITTWVYEYFSVYFEHNTVLHSVLHQAPTEESSE